MEEPQKILDSATGPQVQSQTSLQTKKLSKNVSIQHFRWDLSFPKFKQELNVNMIQIQGLAVVQTQPQVRLSTKIKQLLKIITSTAVQYATAPSRK
jgi:hypothetical protein